MPQKDNVDGGHPGDYHASKSDFIGSSTLKPLKPNAPPLVCSMGRFLCKISPGTGIQW